MVTAAPRIGQVLAEPGIIDLRVQYMTGELGPSDLTASGLLGDLGFRLQCELCGAEDPQSIEQLPEEWAEDHLRERQGARS